jgi:hypothetical protein
MKKNDWATRFGAKRREVDRVLLKELERQIAAEDRNKADAMRARPVLCEADEEDATWVESHVDKEMRDNIARAFGRCN